MKVPQHTQLMQDKYRRDIKEGDFVLFKLYNNITFGLVSGFNPCTVKIYVVGSMLGGYHHQELKIIPPYKLWVIHDQLLDSMTCRLVPSAELDRLLDLRKGN